MEEGKHIKRTTITEGKYTTHEHTIEKKKSQHTNKRQLTNEQQRRCRRRR